ncbi:putative peroxisomal half ABC transporter [Microstroma glucosiphilum]|uniref:Putative peroxisomal half ABC transporter n=1 Tax=Pseudomicrostroma glucosiphilum TaxID=1684307 RepID=A0A316UCL6_9BASI|nr:putative peroxisomal half ABC transporter [Pseudomicrostroma glucosiphilum]PWN22936.1 putative peroxisomal half ABC transporter [Pseudomicrostroma glucosiphilum]
MDHALEQVYLPSSDPARDDSYDLLVPHRGRISKVKVRPTKSSTFNTHFADFKKLPPVAGATKASKKKAEKEMSEADQQEARRQENQAVRAEGGAAAASAKKVGVNAEFLRQLKALFRIMIPRNNAKEVFIFALHTSFLILRTYLSVLVARLDGRLVRDLVSANGQGFLRGLGLWFLLAIPSTYTNSMIRYLQTKLAISFRTRMMRYIHDLYLNDGRNFYKVMNLDSRINGVDQFITSDVAQFCSALAALYSNISKPVLDMIVFNYQLASNLGWKGQFALFGNYIITGWILRKATPAFGKLAALEAKLEGDFRAAHSRLIINAEEISFYGGAKTELSILNRAFLRLVKHVSSILKVRIAFNMCEDFVLKYAWSAAGYVIIASPFLFGLKPGQSSSRPVAEKAHTSSEEENHAGVAQKTESYISNRRLLLSLADAGSRLMYSYKELAELSGYTNRVYTLVSTLHLLNKNEFESAERPVDIAADEPWYDMSNISGKMIMGDESISFDNVPIVAPAPGSARGGERLVKDLSLVMNPGTHILLTGANGVGKSAVARVIAGLWPVWSGELKRPSKRDIFFLPQRPYLSAGSLREQVLYPTTFPEWKAGGGSDSELMKILKEVNLAYLPDREGGWETRKEWKDVLSGGEKQRINFARLLFHKPKLAVLDECTSAVSTDVEGGMYATAKATGISLLTISTRLTLLKYHDVLLRLTGETGEDEAHPSWELEVLSGKGGGEGGEDDGPKGLQEEKRELKKKLAEEEGWKKRLEEIKKEMEALK